MSPQEVGTDVRYVTVPEVLGLLEREQGSREELSYEQKLALDQATTFVRFDADVVEELREKLQEIERVTPFHAAKIIDLAPRDADDVRAIFQRDRTPLETSDIDRIIETVSSYLEA